MASVCFYFQVHQPFRLKRYSVFEDHPFYFDNVANAAILRKVAEKCYRPTTRKILDLVRRHELVVGDADDARERALEAGGLRADGGRLGHHATAVATNPRARVRPVHRPPEVPRGGPDCHWTVTIDADAQHPPECFPAFVAAAAVLLAIPGPTITLVIAYALSRGRQAAWWTVGGVVLGDFTAMTASLLGLGALLAASATAFTLVKCLGAAYLVWLGISLWRAPVAPSAEAATVPVPGRRIFVHAFAVTALNPKGIVFFVAFLPQFLDPGGDFWTQMLVFEATFVTLAFANAFAFALLGARAGRLASSPRALRLVNRAGGSALIAAGAAAALARRTA